VAYYFKNAEKIERNSATCKLCGDEIESKHRWDYVTCSCGEIAVDGGTDYLRRAARNMENLIDTSLPGKVEPKQPRILLWDVETSLNILTSFSLYPKFIHHNNILQDWYIICGSWKFLDEPQINSACVTFDRERFDKNPADDYEVARQLRDALLEADIIVHHNGDKFDIKKLNTRLIYHRLDPLPNKLTTVDTLKEARRTFAFTSNRLDYLGKYLGVGEKIVTEPDLWTNALAGDKAAIQSMLDYNKQDVKLLENVYSVMRPYIKHPNVTAFSANDNEFSCISCGSAKLAKRGFTVSLAGRKQRYQCISCGKWSHSPELLTTTALRTA
jgi:hypothetical protein